MARTHITMPDELLASLEMVADKYSVNKSKLIRRGIKLAVAELEGFYGKAANDATSESLSADLGLGEAKVAAAGGAAPAAPLPEPTPIHRVTVVPLKVVPKFAIRFSSAFGITWFSLEDVCRHLGVSAEDVLAEIESSNHMMENGAQYIDDRGLAEARTLCPDPTLADEVASFCASLAS